jgi:hypothetical protein
MRWPKRTAGSLLGDFGRAAREDLLIRPGQLAQVVTHRQRYVRTICSVRLG